MEEKNMKKSSKRGLVIGAVILVVLVAVMALAVLFFGEKPVSGSKEITIEVVDKEQESIVYELKTDAEYLRGAMDEAEGLSYSGTEGPYGIMIDTVNGLRADYNLDGAYWYFYVNGAGCNYGIDEQPVMDGDAFQIIYTLAQ